MERAQTKIGIDEKILPEKSLLLRGQTQKIYPNSPSSLQLASTALLQKKEGKENFLINKVKKFLHSKTSLSHQSLRRGQNRAKDKNTLLDCRQGLKRRGQKKLGPGPGF